MVSLLASFLTSGLMASAYFIAHAPQGFWPILNGGELAIAYCWLSFFFAAHGPGAWAVDHLRSPVPVGLSRDGFVPGHNEYTTRLSSAPHASKGR